MAAGRIGPGESEFEALGDKFGEGGEEDEDEDVLKKESEKDSAEVDAWSRLFWIALL